MATTASARVLARLDLPSAAAYERGRVAYLQYLTLTKQRRRVRLGPHAALLFENVETVRAQILEVLRIEGDTSRRRSQLAEEYACLLPVAGELRATLFIDGDDLDVATSLGRGARRRGGLELRTSHATFDSVPADRCEELSAVHYLAFVPSLAPSCGRWRLRALATDDGDAILDVAIDDAVKDTIAEDLVLDPDLSRWRAPTTQVFASRRPEESTSAWPF